MIFHGRSFDTFESALAMLNDGEPLCDYIDCLSGRAFSLNRESDHALFSCTLLIEDAVNNINSILGDVFSIVSPVDVHEPFVVESLVDIGIPTIFRKYYRFGHYVFCLRKGNKIFVHDPDGFPCLSYPVEHFNFGKQQVIIRTSVNPSFEINVDIVREKARELINISRSSAIATNCNRIFLQYAIRNYICQTNKVLAFFQTRTSAPNTIQNRIESLFADMLSITKYSFKEINKIDDQICYLLKEIICS